MNEKFETVLIDGQVIVLSKITNVLWDDGLYIYSGNIALCSMSKSDAAMLFWQWYKGQAKDFDNYEVENPYITNSKGDKIFNRGDYQVYFKSPDIVGIWDSVESKATRYNYQGANAVDSAIDIMLHLNHHAICDNCRVSHHKSELKYRGNYQYCAECLVELDEYD